MDVTETDVNVNDANDDAFDAVDDDDVDIQLQHYELDDEYTLKAGESLDQPILVPTRYFVAYSYNGPVSDDAKQSAALEAIQNGDDPEQAVEDLPDRVSGAEVFHSNADGEIGVTFASREEMTLDEVVADFLETKRAQLDTQV